MYAGVASHAAERKNEMGGKRVSQSSPRVQGFLARFERTCSYFLHPRLAYTKKSCTMLLDEPDKVGTATATRSTTQQRQQRHNLPATANGTRTSRPPLQPINQPHTCAPHPTTSSVRWLLHVHFAPHPTTCSVRWLLHVHVPPHPTTCSVRWLLHIHVPPIRPHFP